MDYYQSAVDGWLDNLRRFADYRGELVEALRTFGEDVTAAMKAGHPPGQHPETFEDRTGWLTDSIGYSIEAISDGNAVDGTAAALPTLLVFATAPYADAVEFGVPGHSKAYPFFWPRLYELLPALVDKIDAIMAKADALKFE